MKKFENNILILFAHPALQNSRVNRQLIKYVAGLDGVTFHDLYEAYPDFNIDVKHEQNLLLENDIIVFHHPLFWFSVPAILREWMDLVLQHMWAYGKTGKALRGKKLFNVVTTGGRESLFRHDGNHGNTMVEFLAPIRQSAYVCGMDFLPPFVVHGTRNITLQEITSYGEDYQKMIVSLRDGKVNFKVAWSHQRLNSDLESIITT
ncbi:MAG: NAD(P)H-dependent oxidoreductase [Desulfobulbaceae bacterium]|uniref:NAD(P)H-dependent oxidoreductase n=1 Tax=Candidatus Desulfobia pelagia TaxID=2841692 RepID=A0A8J6TD81_9BACT|nr:NAD(P)H-dependent oxidoreductase [Candidatus Desulfobia pelagia]